MADMARSRRFADALAPEASQFLSSLQFDWRLLPYDIDGSLAHVAMLHQQNIIPSSVYEKIRTGLLSIKDQWFQGTLKPRIEWEDVHMNVEGRLRELIGPDAGYLHTARSRNDQVVTDMHLYMRDEAIAIQKKLLSLMQSLTVKAQETTATVMPGYTHLQPAQPILMAHHWLAYAWMFQRDLSRLKDWHQRANQSPLGAGALAGTPYPTDPIISQKLLGFSSLYPNSLDAVSDRDFPLEFLSAASLIMVHLSRLGEELVLWSSHEFGYITVGDSYSTGSSIMPQKRNPDVAELLRGKSGRVFGHLMALLTVMKGLPLAYNSDMQEDKEAVFDTIDTVKAALTVASGIVSSLRIHSDRLRQRAGENFTNATDLADRLTTRGMPFREAHHRVGELVRILIEQGLAFHTVPEALWEELAPDIPWAWLSELSPETLVEKRQQSFATATASVMSQLSTMKAFLESFKDANQDALRDQR